MEYVASPIFPGRKMIFPGNENILKLRIYNFKDYHFLAVVILK